MMPWRMLGREKAAGPSVARIVPPGGEEGGGDRPGGRDLGECCLLW